MRRRAQQSEALLAAAALSGAVPAVHSIPEREQSWFCGLPCEGVGVLYLYGLGAGEYLAEARRWLDGSDDRHIFLLDSHPGRLQAWVDRHHLLIEHDRLHVDWVVPHRLQQLASYSCLMPFLYACVPGHEAEGLLYEDQILDARMTVDSVAIKLLDLNTHFYPHFYRNLQSLPGALHAAQLYGKFKGVPIIICGAGPSLNSALYPIQALQDRALIVGCGSALTALTRSGIRPHLGAGFCSTEEEIKRFFHAAAYEIPTIYRMRLHAEAADLISGFRIYTNGSCGLEVVSWVEQELGLDADPLEEGPSIVYLATDLAHRMGCDPIVYVGLDLAYTGGLSYAHGVGAEDRPVKTYMWRPDMDGNVTRTKRPWICESHMIGQLIKSRPGPSYFNATTGGIGIPGVPNVALEHLAASWPTLDVQGKLHSALVQATMNDVTPQRVGEIVSQLCESLDRCIAHLTILINQSSVIDEIELLQEVAYQKILNPIAQIRKTFLARMDHMIPPLYEMLLDEALRHREIQKCNLSMISPSVNTEERAITLESSRMFPGQS